MACPRAGGPFRGRRRARNDRTSAKGQGAGQIGGGHADAESGTNTPMLLREAAHRSDCRCASPSEKTPACVRPLERSRSPRRSPGVDMAASAGWWGAEDLSVCGDPVGGDHVLGGGETVVVAVIVIVVLVVGAAVVSTGEPVAPHPTASKVRAASTAVRRVSTQVRAQRWFIGSPRITSPPAPTAGAAGAQSRVTCSRSSAYPTGSTAPDLTGVLTRPSSPTRPRDGRGSVCVSSFRRPRARAAVTGIPPTASGQLDAAHARTQQPVPPCLDHQHELCQ